MGSDCRREIESLLTERHDDLSSRRIVPAPRVIRSPPYLFSFRPWPVLFGPQNRELCKRFGVFPRACWEEQSLSFYQPCLRPPSRQPRARDKKIGWIEAVPAMGLDGLGSSSYGPEAARLGAEAPAHEQSGPSRMGS